jgi:hypothetical protein
MLAPGARRLACAPPSPRAASGASRYAVSSRRGWIERGARDGRGVDLTSPARSTTPAGSTSAARGAARRAPRAGRRRRAPASTARVASTGCLRTTCTVTVTSVELPPHVANMGIVTFTASLPVSPPAEIHFGPDSAAAWSRRWAWRSRANRRSCSGWPRTGLTTSASPSPTAGRSATARTARSRRGPCPAEGLAEASIADGAAPGSSSPLATAGP